MNLTALIADVRGRLDEAGTGSDLMWSDAETTRWLNQASREMAVELEDLEAIGAQSIVASQATYPLPADCLKLTRVLWNSVSMRPISRTRLREHESEGQALTAQLGTPGHFYMWAGNIYLYPVPTTALAGGLVLWYYKSPVELVLGTDVPEHATHLHDILPLYVLFLGYTKDDESNKAQVSLRQWQERLMDKRVFLGVEDRVELGMIQDGDD